jgi:hypothetical protein
MTLVNKTKPFIDYDGPTGAYVALGDRMLSLENPEAKSARNPAPQVVCTTGQPGLEPGIPGFGDRCLSQFGHCPKGPHRNDHRS